MSTSDLDEPAAWRASLEGSDRAFGQLFDAHHARVYARALQATGSSHDAEEVTATVFFECWRLRHRVRVVDGSIIGWLLVTTTNTARNLDRSRRRYRALLARLPTDHAQHDHADDVAGRLDQAAVDDRTRAEFDKLSTRDREVLVLCLVEGFSAAAAAAVLGIPEGTVKSRLARARRRLSEGVSGGHDRFAQEAPHDARS
ncbi:RNA polymerase sigma factor [Herbiconiux sp. P15]|uniref:RNA polymerase sigma factor n=1 Tax=Herbiconiux liukaitaii TaxID=3342799 RepID=UPI0035B827A1